MNKAKSRKSLDISLFFKLFLFARKKSQINYIAGLFLTLITGLMEFRILAELSNIFLLIEGKNPKIINNLSNFCIKNNYEFCSGFSNASNKYIIYFLVLIFITLFLRLSSSYISSITTAGLSIDIGKKVFSKIIRMNYKDLGNENSSKLIGLCVNDIESTAIAFNQFSLIIYCSVIALFILAGMIYGGSKQIFLIIILILFFYINFINLTRTRLSRNGEFTTKKRYKSINIIQEAIGNLINIMISRTHSVYINRFNDNNAFLRKLDAESLFIKLTPKILVETFILITITFLAILISLNTIKNPLEELLPILGVIAVGSQRLIQLSQQIFIFWSSVILTSTSARNILKKLNTKDSKLYPNFSDKKEEFKFKSLKLDDISYLHEDPTLKNKHGIKNISLELKEGDSLGILGKTGSGKSTLINLMLGLYFPQNGILRINGNQINDFYNNEYLINYQKNISYVPQRIFLMNASVLENITCFSLEEVDVKYLNKIINICDLEEVLNSLPRGIDTYIGENGSKLSGGQQQRIGIARALYNKNSEILFLDEATNALDLKTERKIMENIKQNQLFKTNVIITHREENLKYCSRYIKLANGHIME